MADPNLRYPQQIDVDLEINPIEYVNETESESESEDITEDEYIDEPGDD